MKKFIEAINEKGITRKIVKCIKLAKKQTGDSDSDSDSEGTFDAIKIILKIEMMKDEKLFDVFYDEIQELGFKFIAEYIDEQIQESEKIDAMNKVDPDALFRKATGQEDNEENHEAEDDKVGKAFFDFLNALFDDLK